MNLVPNAISPKLAQVSPEDAGLLPERLARLGAVMRREVETKHVPGVTMLISRRGKVAYRENFGALRPGGPAMRGDGIFRIYSMTKPIVSVAVMMLVEEGRLFISDPLAKYIPEFASPKVGVEKGGKLELVAAQARDHHPGSAAPYLRPHLRLHGRIGGAAPLCARRRCARRTSPARAMWRRSPGCRFSISRERIGTTATRRMCWDASSRSSRERRSEPS